MAKKSKLQTAFEFALSNGLEEFSVDGITIKIPHPQAKAKEPSEEEIKRLSVPAEPMTEEEVLFFHSSYFDEIQYRKEAMKKARLEKEGLNG